MNRPLPVRMASGNDSSNSVTATCAAARRDAEVALDARVERLADAHARPS